MIVEHYFFVSIIMEIVSSTYEKAKSNKIVTLGLIGLGYYYLSKQKTQEELGECIRVKEQELREFSQHYLTTQRTRVGLDSAIRPYALEIASRRKEYLERFKVDYAAV